MNKLFFERLEHADNPFITLFVDMAEVEAFDYPDELWRPEGVEYFFFYVGDFLSADDYCF